MNSIPLNIEGSKRPHGNGVKPLAYSALAAGLLGLTALTYEHLTHDESVNIEKPCLHTINDGSAPTRCVASIDGKMEARE